MNNQFIGDGLTELHTFISDFQRLADSSIGELKINENSEISDINDSIAVSAYLSILCAGLAADTLSAGVAARLVDMSDIYYAKSNEYKALADSVIRR